MANNGTTQTAVGGLANGANSVVGSGEFNDFLLIFDRVNPSIGQFAYSNKGKLGAIWWFPTFTEARFVTQTVPEPAAGLLALAALDLLVAHRRRAPAAGQLPATARSALARIAPTRATECPGQEASGNLLVAFGALYNRQKGIGAGPTHGPRGQKKTARVGMDGAWGESVRDIAPLPTNRLEGSSMRLSKLATAMAVSAVVVGGWMPAHAAIVSATAVDTTASFNTVVVQDTGLGGGVNNARYLPSVADANYSGVVNLWFRDASGVVRSGCTGSLLNQRTILSAGHCVSTGTNSISWASFTARFRNADGSVTEVNGSGFKVQEGYSGAVVEEQDVAVLTLNSDAPSTARTYSLFNGDPLQLFTLAGYGRIGDGLTGDSLSSGQFGAGLNTLRSGRNRFETTGRDGAIYATSLSPNPAAYGGILRGDVDRDGLVTHQANFMCASLGFCDLGEDLDEVGVGRGDSGGSAFTDGWEVLGVASFAQTANGSTVGQYGTSFGYACVANFAANAACLANYQFVVNNLWRIPEPGSMALFGVGLVAFAAARRRRLGR